MSNQIGTASRTTGWVALATAVASILSTVLIILFYTVGGLFGTINDIFNGIAGILGGILAWALFSQFHLNSPIQRVALMLAVIGAVIVVVGSILIIFDLTGWMLAGWYTTVGNALIGIWLLAFCNSMQQSKRLPHNLCRFGSIVGSIMTLGIITIAGIIMKVDSFESVPWYLYLGYLGYVGTYFLYPAWTIWLGRTLLTR